MKRLISGLWSELLHSNDGFFVRLTILDHQLASRAMLLTTPQCMCMRTLGHPGSRILCIEFSDHNHKTFWAQYTHSSSSSKMKKVKATEFQLSCGHRGMQETSNFPDSDEASQTPCMTSCDDGFHLLPGNCDGKDLDAGHRLCSSAVVF